MDAEKLTHTNNREMNVNSINLKVIEVDRNRQGINGYTWGVDENKENCLYDKIVK